MISPKSRYACGLDAPELVLFVAYMFIAPVVLLSLSCLPWQQAR